MSEILSPIASFRVAHKTAETLTDTLSPTQMLWTPGGDAWSLAQILDHLNRVGYAMLPLLEAAVASLKADNKRSAAPFKPSFVENWFINAVSPGGRMTMPVPPLYEPARNAAELANALPRFLALQDSLIGVIESAEGLNLGGVKVTSPASSLLRVRLGAWFLALPAHQNYHLLQLKAQRALVEKNAGF